MRNELLGSFKALTIDGTHYVVFEDLYKITKISIHDDFEEAEKMAKNLNTLYSQ